MAGPVSIRHHEVVASVTRPNGILVAVAAAIGVVLVAAAIVATRPVPDLDPATPEGVVQAFTRATLADDVAGALALATPDFADRCSTSPVTFEDGGLRMGLIDTSISGDVARVRVRVTQSGGSPPFDLSEYESSGTFVLRRLDGAWLIDEAPWEIYPCVEESA